MHLLIYEQDHLFSSSSVPGGHGPPSSLLGTTNVVLHPIYMSVILRIIELALLDVCLPSLVNVSPENHENTYITSVTNEQANLDSKC